MDINTMKPASEKHRSSEGQSVNEGKDRFKDLQDTVIQNILAFLPTKDAVRTSILSTRWKYLWISIPNLDFNDGVDGNEVLDKTKFADFVDRVLNLHNELNIKKFSLTCSNHDESRVQAWVYGALQRNVHELDLHVCVKKFLAFIILPEHVCNSESLTVLKLQSNYGLVIPTPFSLPNLKILHLRSIVYSSALSTQPLFSSCPALLELILDKCHMSGFSTIVISVPSVQSFRLYDAYRDSGMKIYAENLKSFLYVGGMSNDLTLCNTSYLVDAYVEVNAEYRPEEIGPRATKLLRQLSNVKFLAVTNITISALAHDTSLYASLPIFQNLMHMELSTEIMLEHTRILMALIENSPNVEHLHFEKKICPRNYIETDKSTVQALHGRFMSLLKSVKFNEFCGNIVEAFLMRFILNSATTLERMTVRSSEELSKNGTRQRDIPQLLRRTPKASKSCLIDYS